MPEMLPALCAAVGEPRCTNHQLRFESYFLDIFYTYNFRTTAIIYMRRAGVPWLTIAKITGHQSIENLVQHYDLNIEVRNCIFFI